MGRRLQDTCLIQILYYDIVSTKFEPSLTLKSGEKRRSEMKKNRLFFAIASYAIIIVSIALGETKVLGGFAFIVFVMVSAVSAVVVSIFLRKID